MKCSSSPILGPFRSSYALAKAAHLPHSTVRSIVAGCEPKVRAALAIAEAHRRAGCPTVTAATLWPLDDRGE